MKSEIIETNTVQMWVDDNDIMWVKILPQAYLTLEDAEKNVALMHKLAAGHKKPVLVEMKRIKGIAGDARKFSAGKAVESITLALAMCIGSPLGKAIGNFWVSINKPPFPTKMFTSEEEAVEWLKGFIE